MGNLNSKQRDFLAWNFGERANFRKTEWRLYGHDIAAMPLGMGKMMPG